MQMKVKVPTTTKISGAIGPNDPKWCLYLIKNTTCDFQIMQALRPVINLSIK